MCKEKKGKKLHSLSPKTNLDQEENAAFGVYKEYLDAVFRDPDRRNIALVGKRGVGKSSVIHSYDNKSSYSRRFLYISLADFEERTSNPAQTGQGSPTPPPQGEAEKVGGKKPEKKESEQELTQKRLEYSMLCQILARCSTKDLRGSTLLRQPAERTVYQRSSNWFSAAWNWLITVLFPYVYLSVSAGLLFMLAFENQLAVFLPEKVSTNIPLPAFLRELLTKDTLPKLRGYIYAALFVLLLLGLLYLKFQRWDKRIQLSKLTVKTNKTESEWMLSDEKYCLDYFKFELVHILNRMARGINYTVVFEDMERLDQRVGIEILMKLRELNQLINSFRMSKNKKVKPIRFVYALDASRFSGENKVKFFDTILSVVPKFNRHSSQELIRTGLQELGIEINDTAIASTITEVSEFFLDYRCAQAVINEFVLLRDLARANKMGVARLTWYQRIAALLRIRPRQNAAAVSLTVYEDSALLLLAVQNVMFPNGFEQVDDTEQGAMLTGLWDYLNQGGIPDGIEVGLELVGYPKRDILQQKIQRLVRSGPEERRREARHFTVQDMNWLRNDWLFLSVFEKETYPLAAFTYARILFQDNEKVLDQLKNVNRSRWNDTLLTNYLEAMIAREGPLSQDREKEAAELFCEILKKCRLDPPDQTGWNCSWEELWDGALGMKLVEILKPIKDTLDDQILDKKPGTKKLRDMGLEPTAPQETAQS